MQRVPRAASSEDSQTISPRNLDAMWPELLSESLADTELQFDAQAFFDDYMSTGETSRTLVL